MGIRSRPAVQCSACLITLGSALRSFSVCSLCQLGSVAAYQVASFPDVICIEGHQPSLMAGTFSSIKLFVSQGLERPATSLAL